MQRNKPEYLKWYRDLVHEGRVPPIVRFKSQLPSLAVFVSLSLVLLAACGSASVDGIGSINTENYANLTLEYYYYIPTAILENRQKAYPILIVVPGLSGDGKASVTREFKAFADAESFVIVAPSFTWDEDNWSSSTSYQYPSAWSGEALLRIVDQLEGANNVTTSKMHLFGFSAGAQFALRLCLWRSDLCDACAAHGSGGTVIPTRKVDVRFLVTVGKQDGARMEKAEAFSRAAQDLGIDVTYAEYQIGHSLSSSQITDSFDFFRASDG